MDRAGRDVLNARPPMDQARRLALIERAVVLRAGTATTPAERDRISALLADPELDDGTFEDELDRLAGAALRTTLAERLRIRRMLQEARTAADRITDSQATIA